MFTRSLLQIGDIQFVKIDSVKGRKTVTTNQHFLEIIPVPENHKITNLFPKCRECTKNKVKWLI